jgi:galactokinase
VTPSSEQRVFWAPGRVNLIGEHTDYSGGVVLPAAISRGVTISGACADRIELQSELDGTTAVLAGDGSSPQPPSGWTRFVEAVARELHELGRPPLGITGTVASNVPVGAGLASSAALEVAVATALCALADWDALTPLELAAACQRAERRAVGVPCGILDQAASVLGEEGAAVYLDCASLEYEAIPLPEGVAIVVVDSGVRHELEHSAYAERRRELDEALVVLRGRRPADLSVDEADALASAGGLDDLHRRRLRHVVSENERVRAFVAALRSNPADVSLLGTILWEGHASQRDDYETSTPELDRLVEQAYELGAIGARMTGGGFGGSMVALVEIEHADAFADAIIDGASGSISAFICSAVAGAGELVSRS